MRLGSMLLALRTRAPFGSRSRTASISPGCAVRLPDHCLRSEPQARARRKREQVETAGGRVLAHAPCGESKPRVASSSWSSEWMRWTWRTLGCCGVATRARAMLEVRRRVRRPRRLGRRPGGWSRRSASTGPGQGSCSPPRQPRCRRSPHSSAGEVEDGGREELRVVRHRDMPDTAQQPELGVGNRAN